MGSPPVKIPLAPSSSRRKDHISLVINRGVIKGAEQTRAVGDRGHTTASPREYSPHVVVRCRREGDRPLVVDGRSVAKNEKTPLLSAMVMICPPFTAKMPSSNVFSPAKNATVPLLLMAELLKKVNGPLVSAMVWTGPPLPAKMPTPKLSSSMARKGTVPLLLMSASPEKRNRVRSSGNRRQRPPTPSEYDILERVQSRPKRHLPVIVYGGVAERQERRVAGVRNGGDVTPAAGENTLQAIIEEGSKCNRPVIVYQESPKESNTPLLSAIFVKV